MNLETTVNEIAKELVRAEKKFPTWPTDPNLAISIINEEVGELTRAGLHYSFDHGRKKDMINEAIQTAAMAIQFIMNADSYRIPHYQNFVSKRTD